MMDQASASLGQHTCRRPRPDNSHMEDWTKAKIAWVLCCLLGLWYRGGQEPVQAYIFTVAFIFLCFWMYILEDHY